MNIYPTPSFFRSAILVSILFLGMAPALRAGQLDVGSGYPYATVTAAAQDAVAGDMIFVHSGTYVGGEYITDLQGTAEKPIVIFADMDGVNVIGGTEAWHLSDVAYLQIIGFEFTGQSGNGVNIDDGGTYDTPSHHILLQSCYFHDLDASGNNDLLKLSGLDSFEIRGCRFLNGSEGGSGIDMVGCHNGLIVDNSFRNMGSNSIQVKGGSQFVRIERNTYVDGGERAVNLGGSTDFDFFRPISAMFEAADIQVYSSIFIGSVAPIAYVGSVRVSVVNNTIWMPEKWVMRILQETVADRLLSCGENAFCNNIVVIDGRVTTEVNIGPDTRPETFLIANNLWYSVENPSWSGPSLPVTELAGIVGQDPLLKNPANGEFAIAPTSPAVGKGAAVGDPVYDYTASLFRIPPSIGAFEADLSSSALPAARTLVQNPAVRIVPNPSLGTCELLYTLKDASEITIELYDSQGKAINRLFEGREEAGDHRHEIRLPDDAGTLLLLLNVDGTVYTSRIIGLNGREK